MHEIGIANSILEAVRQESDFRHGARVVKVGLRIGELAAVDPESLRFCFEALVSGTDLDPLALDLEFRPRCNRCQRCGKLFRVAEFPVTCPKCNCAETQFAGGDELEFAYMEIEET
jgi:hydrogenase nickel incorporation protein HypA/HybF